jgi:hypothetical protein
MSRHFELNQPVQLQQPICLSRLIYFEHAGTRCSLTQSCHVAILGYCIVLKVTSLLGILNYRMQSDHLIGNYKRNQFYQGYDNEETRVINSGGKPGA